MLNLKTYSKYACYSCGLRRWIIQQRISIVVGLEMKSTMDKSVLINGFFNPLESRYYNCVGTSKKMNKFSCVMWKLIEENNFARIQRDAVLKGWPQIATAYI